MSNSDLKHLLNNAIDMHVHTAPSHSKRLVDDFELCHMLSASGMKGALIKAHEGSTTVRAEIATKHSGTSARIFGGIVLNNFVGGLNPVAVEGDIRLGCKVVWMPTLHAKNHKRVHKDQSEGISLLNDQGNIKDEVIEIIDLVANADIVLATGHVSNIEGIKLCEEALRRGVKRVVFTHPDFKTNMLPLNDQISLVKKGVIMEKTLFSLTEGSIDADFTARSIIEIGAEHCLLNTDYGQINNPAIPEGLESFFKMMLERGVSESMLITMTQDVPEYLLSIQ